jgi:lipopolysaccharide export system protein LptA
MRHHIPLYILVLTLGAAVFASSPCVAQNGPKPSSINSLNSNALLGDSFNDKDFGKLPTHITSDSLTLHAKNRVFVYKGNVVVTQGDMKLTSNEVEGNYSEQNQIQKIVAKGDVVITKQDIQATSQRAIYDAVTSIVTLTDNPQLQQGESVLIADRIKVLLNENRSLAEGNVRVTFVKQEGTPLAAAGAAAKPDKASTPTAEGNTPAPTPSPAPKSTPVAKQTASSKAQASGKAPAKKSQAAAKPSRR